MPLRAGPGAGRGRRPGAPGSLPAGAWRSCRAGGGGQIDPDTVVSEGSYEAALLAAGAGLEAIRRLDAGEGDAAFCAVRPPGHHATPAPGHGLLPRQQRVGGRRRAGRPGRARARHRLRRPPRQRHPGRLLRRPPRRCTSRSTSTRCTPARARSTRPVGARATGTTVNVPVPAGHDRRRLPAGVRRGRGPAGRGVAADLAAGVRRLRRPPGRPHHRPRPDAPATTPTWRRPRWRSCPPGGRVFFLEGGYDLQGLADSAGATLAALAGERYRPEAPTAGGPGAPGGRGGPRPAP